MGMMPQRLQTDIYRSLSGRAQRVPVRPQHEHAANDGIADIAAIRRSIDRLRFLHVPVTLLVLRVKESNSDHARGLLRNRLQGLGYSGILPNGDVAMLYVGSPDVNDNNLAEVEHLVLDLISRQMMAFVVCGMEVRCFAAFAHLWSDEIWDTPDFVNLANYPQIAMVEIKPASESGRVAHFDAIN